MREVSLYVNNVKLDLFKDEEIQVTSTIQNVQDISKVFTDFTQTFTIPCSRVNNEVFEYYYNSDVDASFNAQNRQPARLEINNVPFRSGKLQLESAETKGLESDNYKVTFYGDITTLKDLFANDKLSDLDYPLTVSFDEATVLNAQDDPTDLDVRFPLISSNRIWEYGDASPADISTLGGAIAYTELFPAVKDSVIMDAIETRYGITLTGLFLTDERFTQRFTLWKNRKTAGFTNTAMPVLFGSGGSKPLLDNVFYLQWIDPVTYAPAGSTQQRTTKTVNLFITTDTTGEIFISTYKNGVFVNSISRQAVSGVELNHVVINPVYSTTGNQNVEDEYTFKISSYLAMNITGNIRLRVNGYWVTSTGVAGTSLISTIILPFDAIVISNEIDFKASAPDITVAEYFSGILNQFNLTCFPTNEDLTFQLEPIPNWYAIGKAFNITQYVDDKSIQYERIKLYKNIEFKYQECKSFMNVEFKNAFNQNYGDLNEQFNFDGGEFKIQLPFENLYFNRFPGTELQVGYSMTEPIENADKSYIPKCTGLYLEKKEYDCDFYIGTNNVLTYYPFGQDLTLSGTIDHTINFGLEQSTLKNEVIDNSLFLEYYYPYLNSLFNPKARKVMIKGRFPLWLLNDVKLNSKLIIRDKKYLIESIKTNLTNGDVDLVLINSFLSETSGIPLNPTLDFGGGVIVVPIDIPTDNNGRNLGFTTVGTIPETQFVTTSPALPTDVTTPTNFEITVPTNATGLDRVNTIPFEYKDLDGNILYTNYVTVTQLRESEKLTGGGLQLYTNLLDELTT